MEIAHFSMFHGQKHDFFLTPPYCFNIEVFNIKVSFLKSAKCRTIIFKNM